MVCYLSTTAQNTSVSLQKITINDGLSQGFVSAIFQDHQGFLWMGTMDGLNRYDGYEFRKFKHDLEDSRSLSGNSISCITEDWAKRLWVGTSQNGLNLFNRAKETWQRIELGSGLPDSNQFNAISHIKEDATGKLWVKTKHHHLFCVEVTPDGSVSAAKVDLPGNWSMQESTSYKIISSGSGGLLAVAFDTLMSIEAQKKPFLIQSFPPFLQFVEAYGKPQIIALHQDHKGNLWLGDRNGMYRYFPLDQRWEHYPLHHLSEGVVNEIFIGRNGTCWFRKGLDVYQVSVQNLVNEQAPTPQWICTDGHTIFEDASGITWIGTVGHGVYKYVPQLQQFKHLLKGEVVYQMHEVGMDSLWLTGKLFDLTKNTSTSLSFSGLLPREIQLIFGTNSLHHKQIVWFAQDVRDSEVEGDYIRLNRVDLKNMTRSHYDYRMGKGASGSNAGIYTFMDQSEMLWLINDRMMLPFDPQSGLFGSPFSLGTSGDHSGFARSVIHVTQDHTGLFWIGTSKGIVRVNPEDGSIERLTQKSGLSSNEIRCFHEGEKGEMWVGTHGGGLNHINTTTGKITYFLEKDGLPNNVVYGILEDAQNKLWMSTNHGLSQFDPAREIFRNYDMTHGLQSNEFNTGSFLKTENGNFLFGGMNGITAFSPERIEANPVVPPIAFTDFKLNNVSVESSASNTVLKESITTSRSITLAYHQNMFSIGFAALEYSVPEKNLYAYQLEGLSEEWIYAGHNRQATFTNLEPGEYTLRVKGANNDGIWNPEMATLQIIVMPPWWRTIWAYTAYALLVLSLIWAIVHFLVRRERLKNQLLLEEQEANRLRELDQFKQRFFANITHEFKTPISLILGRSSQLLERLNQEDERKKLNTIFQNAERLLALVNQLLDLAKLQEGALKSEPRKADMVAYLKELLQHFELSASNRQIQLRLESHILATAVSFDFSILDKVISNLVSNALKFCEPGGNVTVIMHQIDPSNIAIEVQDDGIGMDEETVSRAFERFYQGDNASEQNGEGTGIGLALVKELVQHIGGDIAVTSKPGAGSVFKLRIPIENQQAAQRTLYDFQPTNEAMSLPSESSASLQGGQVLIVEDNDDLRDYIASCISSEFEIITASDGEEGLARAQEFIPDIIILDIMMPKMDGIEMLRKLRSTSATSHIPVIMLTARSSSEARINSFEAGADAYLSKPFDPNELRVRLKQIAQSRQLLQEKYKHPEAINDPLQAGLSSVDHTFLEKVQTCVLEGLDRPSFNTEDLATALHMSRPHLYRKIKAITNLSISRYMRAIRLAKACELLQQGLLNVSEVSYSTGFSSNTYFAQCFKEQYGVSPTDFVKAASKPSV